MAPRSSRSKPAPTLHNQTSDAQLSTRDERPPQLFVLPTTSSSEARFVSLANPATGKLTRYLYCPDNGFHEFTRIGNPTSTPQSCLLAPPTSDTGTSTSGHEALDVESDPSSLASGYVMHNAELLVATPIDPTFFLLPLFKTDFEHHESHVSLARTVDDYLDDLARSSAHMGQLLLRPNVRSFMTEHLEAMCDTVIVGDDVAYRLNVTTFLTTLIDKAQWMVEKAWPKTLEHYVQKQLEVPVIAQGMQPSIGPVDGSNGDLNVADGLTAAGATESPARNGDTKPQPGEQMTENITQQLRVRTALEYILTSYIGDKWRMYLKGMIAGNKVHDFANLDARLAFVKRARAEAQASRSISDNFSRKRGAVDDAEAEEIRNEKKRKKDEEEKKRKAESRATKDLKKVNTSGMKKMSSFFTKRPTSAAS